MKYKSTLGTVQKHWIVFIYIRSEYYKLDKNFDDTELKNQSDHTSKDKFKCFRENVVVVEE